MKIGARLRQLREQKGLSQGDIEAATGLLRCYTSRVENGHTVPSLETLERFAGALEVPLFMLFYEGDGQPPTPALIERPSLGDAAALGTPEEEDANYLLKLARLVVNIGGPDREALLSMARTLATH
ncbi:MAG: transcriptional regulator [Acidobacteria bacterium]|nr:MAG: transcriptional regulator [Acidobacteriota bacterium]